MIIYQHHIMWYELNMINETLDSLLEAVKLSPEPIQMRFCFNYQTYLEKPIEDNIERDFNRVLDHPIFSLLPKKYYYLEYKKNTDSFYNIGDWRREIYKSDAKYTVWGESDCLIPEDYFYILSNIHIPEPHILSLSSRIMWDDTWTGIEHEDFQKYPNLDNKNPSCEELTPFRYYDVINQNQLNEFNGRNDIKVSKLPFWKVDGALLSLSCNLPHPFIPKDMHFVREDTCAEQFFKKHNIPQYHIITRIKGHNYYHPQKRTNTLSTRSDQEW